MILGAEGHSNAVRPHACMRMALNVGVCGYLAQVTGGRENIPLPLRMVARGSRTKRGGRSLAVIISSWELRLAEAADYLLRAALGVRPRPHWGPFWLLPASRAELENYLAAVA